MASIAEKVFDLLQDMPEKEAGEVLDCTEFLRQRRQSATVLPLSEAIENTTITHTPHAQH